MFHYRVKHPIDINLSDCRILFIYLIYINIINRRSKINIKTAINKGPLIRILRILMFSISKTVTEYLSRIIHHFYNTVQ